MAIKALSLTTRTSHELESDSAKGTPEATVFELGQLDTFVVMGLQSQSLKMDIATQSVRDADIFNLYLKACKFGIKGWKNLQDQDGKEVAFRTVSESFNNRRYDVLDDSLLAIIPRDAVLELGLKILTLNQPTTDDLKN